MLFFKSLLYEKTLDIVGGRNVFISGKPPQMKFPSTISSLGALYVKICNLEGLFEVKTVRPTDRPKKKENDYFTV